MPRDRSGTGQDPAARDLERRLAKYDCRASLGNPGQDRVFVKLAEIDVEDQFLKDKALFELSRAESGFLAPRPLGCIPEARLLSYEHIPGLQSMHAWLPSRLIRFAGHGAELRALFERVGAILAAWHALDLPGTGFFVPEFLLDEQGLELTGLNDRLLAAPPKVLFWDFTLANLSVRPAQGALEIAVFDPAPPRAFLGVRPLSQAPVAVDLGWFLNGLLLPDVPFKYAPLWDWDLAAELGDCFLNGYERRAGQPVDRAAAWGVAARLLRDAVIRRMRGGPARWVLRRSAARYGMYRALSRARASA